MALLQGVYGEVCLFVGAAAILGCHMCNLRNIRFAACWPSTIAFCLVFYYFPISFYKKQAN